MPREHASFLRRLCSGTPMPVSSTADMANLSAFWYAASATASTTRRVRSRSKPANAVAAQRARPSIMRARAAPGGSDGTVSTAAALIRGGLRSGRRSRDRRLARRGRGVAQRLADGDRGAVEDLVDEVRPQQDARLELEHARVERREDRPHPVLVEAAHDELGALGMVELESHDDAVLADPDEPL